MATLQVSGNNASYTLTLSGMSTSTRYHVFIADLDSSGSVSGYKCIRSSLGSSSTWTYNGSSNSPYSNYRRSVYVYTSTAATSHSVGTIYTYDEMRSGCTFMDSNTIPAAGGGSTPTEYTYYGRFNLDANGGRFTTNSSATLSWPVSGNMSNTGTNGGYVSTKLPSSGSSYVPVYSGYTFVGWATTADATTANYYSGDTVGFTAKSTSSSNPTVVTLYAVWKKVYTLSYSTSYSGVTNMPSSSTISGAGYITCSSTIPVLSGYTFKGWAETDGGAVRYVGGNSIYISADKTLYAVWESLTKTYYGRFTLNANGGAFLGTGYTSISWPTGGAMSGTGTSGAYVSTTLPVSTGNYVPTRDGYTFLGWATSSTATSAKYISGDMAGFTATSTSSSSPTTVSLWAVWEESYSGSISVNSYTYDSNDKSFQGTLSVTVTLSPASGSWTLKATHSRTSTSISKTMTASGSTTLSTTLVLPYLYMSSEQTYTITLTAPDGTVVDEIVVPCLDVPTYTLTFNANGGTGAPSALTTYGNVAKVTIPATKPKRLKHKFLGWALGALSTVLEVAVDDLPCEYSLTYSKTLYAVWEATDTIELFTWTGKDTTDAPMIKKGEPVKDVITAEKWNELLLKIKALNDGCNLTFDYTLVSEGSDITHTQFNNARLGLAKIKVALNTTTVIPDAQQKGDIMYASLFNGGGSIKGALNGLIGAYNNA